MTAPTDAELAAMERRRWSHVYHGDGNTAEDDVDALIAALREARATISDLEDELVAARQPTDDLEGALEIVKVDNEDLRAQLAAARAHALTPDEVRVLKIEMRDGYTDDDPTWDEDRDRAPFESAMAKLDAAMAPAPDARPLPTRQLDPDGFSVPLGPIAMAQLSSPQCPECGYGGGYHAAGTGAGPACSRHPLFAAPDARSVMDALGGEIVPTGEQQDAINRAFARESRAISERAP
jgi:hypothetical protein